jgi:hypothetical protein
MKVELSGALAPEIRRFYEVRGQAWLDGDVAKVAGFYNVPLTKLASGRPLLLETPEAIVAATQEDMARWHPQPGGTDFATQLSAPETARSAVVHVLWGGWSVSLPNGRIVHAPECIYILGKPDSEWRIMMVTADWKAVAAAT